MTVVKDKVVTDDRSLVNDPLNNSAFKFLLQLGNNGTL